MFRREGNESGLPVPHQFRSTAAKAKYHSRQSSAVVSRDCRLWFVVSHCVLIITTSAALSSGLPDSHYPLNFAASLAVQPRKLAVDMAHVAGADGNTRGGGGGELIIAPAIEHVAVGCWLAFVLAIIEVSGAACRLDMACPAGPRNI